MRLIRRYESGGRVKTKVQEQKENEDVDNDPVSDVVNTSREVYDYQGREMIPYESKAPDQDIYYQSAKYRYYLNKLGKSFSNKFGEESGAMLKTIWNTQNHEERNKLAAEFSNKYRDKFISLDDPSSGLTKEELEDFKNVRSRLSELMGYEFKGEGDNPDAIGFRTLTMPHRTVEDRFVDYDEKFYKDVSRGNKDFENLLRSLSTSMYGGTTEYFYDPKNGHQQNDYYSRKKAEAKNNLFRIGVREVMSGDNRTFFNQGVPSFIAHRNHFIPNKEFVNELWKYFEMHGDKSNFSNILTPRRGYEAGKEMLTHYNGAYRGDVKERLDYMLNNDFDGIY